MTANGVTTLRAGVTLEDLAGVSGAARSQAATLTSAETIAVMAPEVVPPVTYGELRRKVEHWTDMFAALRLPRSTRVGLALPSGPDLAVTIIAVSANAISAPLRSDSPAAMLSRDCAQLRLDLLLTTRDRVAELSDVGVPVACAEPEAVAALRLDVRGARRPTRPEDIALLLRTSGTTGLPKQVPLTHANLCLSAPNIQRFLRLQATDRCLNIMPLWHVHGFVAGLLATLAAGASAVCPPQFVADEFPGWLECTGATWYTATPSMHRRILKTVAGTGRPSHRLRFIRSASANLPRRVADDLEEVFGVPVIEAYGMTEASHQIASNPLPPAIRKAGSVGVPTGVRVAVRGSDGSLLGPDDDGEIVIRGDSVVAGYEDAADGSAFVDGWFRTGDLGRVDRDGYVFLSGRTKEMINRGGETIAPREIEEVLLDHPAVADAVVLGTPHDSLGETVVAAVVLHPDRRLTEAQLRAFAGTQLTMAKIPTRIGFVEEVPRTSTGKPRRADLAHALATRWAESAATAPATGGPLTGVEGHIAAIWRELLHVDTLDRTDSLAALGSDSLLITRAANRIQSSLGVAVPAIDLFLADTLAGQAALVEPLLASSARASGTMGANP